MFARVLPIAASLVVAAPVVYAQQPDLPEPKRLFTTDEMIACVETFDRAPPRDSYVLLGETDQMKCAKGMSLNPHLSDCMFMARPGRAYQDYPFVWTREDYTLTLRYLDSSNRAVELEVDGGGKIESARTGIPGASGFVSQWSGIAFNNPPDSVSRLIQSVQEEVHSRCFPPTTENKRGTSRPVLSRAADFPEARIGS